MKTELRLLRSPEASDAVRDIDEVEREIMHGIPRVERDDYISICQRRNVTRGSDKREQAEKTRIGKDE